ncbi:MAG: Ku protein [Actinomycetota bacterium]
MPPRTMWRGAISFGLVTIPVKVFPSTEEKSLKFNQLHDKDHGRIKMKRTCSKCGEEVPFENIVKGYEVEKDVYVTLTDDDFEAVPVASSRAIDIQQFVELQEIDPIYFKKSYYLVPDETGIKAYNLLRKALEDESKVGVAKVSFRDKEHLAALRFRDKTFILETMYWPDEIRAADFEELDKEVDVRPQEVQMAKSLIENLSEPFNPEAYEDEYRVALQKIVDAKVKGEEIEVVETEAPSKVVDLMEALKASVEAVKEKPADKKKPAPRKKKAAAG